MRRVTLRHIMAWVGCIATAMAATTQFPELTGAYLIPGAFGVCGALAVFLLARELVRALRRFQAKVKCSIAPHNVVYLLLIMAPVTLISFAFLIGVGDRLFGP